MRTDRETDGKITYYKERLFHVRRSSVLFASKEMRVQIINACLISLRKVSNVDYRPIFEIDRRKETGTQSELHEKRSEFVHSSDKINASS